MLFGVCALPAMAFNSAEWLAACRDDKDMMRLQALYESCTTNSFTPAENVVLPLESYPDGTLKSRISAARAFIFIDTGIIWAEGLHVEQFKPDGVTLMGMLRAENCVVDRKTKSGWVKGQARLKWGEVSVSGKGVYFSLEREFIKIFKDSQISGKGLKFSKQF